MTKQEMDRRKPRGGRPEMPAIDKRTDKIELRLTTAEKIAFREKAEASGQTLSDWLRDLANGHKPRPPVTHTDLAFINELNRIGVNLNQIARSINRGRGLSSDWQLLQDELRAVLKEAAGKL